MQFYRWFSELVKFSFLLTCFKFVLISFEYSFPRVNLVFVKICTLIAMILISAGLGFSHTLLTISMQLVFAEYLPLERFPFGYGFFMFVNGNLGFIIGIITSYVADVTDSYEIPFYLLAFILILCIVPWIIEIAWAKHFRRSSAIETHVSS